MNHERLMLGVSIHHLRFTVQPLEVIEFGDQPGTALRGALYNALSSRFCSEPNGAVTPGHYERCPVCWMLAAENGLYRGRDAPRPLTVEPPPKQVYTPDRLLRFSFTLIGRAQNLLPYLARAVQVMGDIGVGKRRGKFKLLRIAEYSPLIDAERTLMMANREPRQPTLQVTPKRISDEASQYENQDTVRLELITPLRLIADEHLVKTPDPTVFMRRLLERCQSMAQYYGESKTTVDRSEWRQLDQMLKTSTEKIDIVYNDTQWVEVWSHSKNKGYSTPISGLCGVVHWRGDIKTLIPWLLWGQSLHVGKDAVKGNGWYRVYKIHTFKDRK